MKMISCRSSAALAIGLLLFSGCTGSQSSDPAVDALLEPDSEANSSTALGIIQAGSPKPGGQAPTFALRDLDKNIVHLSDFRGKPVVLNFFASWCVPCLAEMPLIQDAHIKSGEEGYVVLGVAVQDSRAALRSLSESMGLTFPMVLDGDSSVGIAYQVLGPPATFFIDENGEIVSVVAGTIEEEALEQALYKLLS
jgi:cytochrome c biogenesis protein CcmG/thiol:disulfide interchange protein DsbE